MSEKCEPSAQSSSSSSACEIATSRNSRRRRTRDDVVGDDIYDYYTSFKANCKRRRQKKDEVFAVENENDDAGTSKPSEPNLSFSTVENVDDAGKSVSSKRTLRDSDPVICPHCNLTLKNRMSYNTHRNVVHGEIVRANIFCPEEDCKVKSTNMHALVKHMNATHQYNLRFETFRFAGDSEFMEWLHELTKDGSVNYVRSSGLKKRDRANDRITLMYYCNRSGRRALRNQAQKTPTKMPAHCPAHFRKVSNKDGTVEVCGQLGHVGHECVPQYRSIESQPSVSEAVATFESKYAKFCELKKVFVGNSIHNECQLSSAMQMVLTAADHIAEACSILEEVVSGSSGGVGKQEEEDVACNSIYCDIPILNAEHGHTQVVYADALHNDDSNHGDHLVDMEDWTPDDYVMVDGRRFGY